MSRKNPLTPAGIETATFPFVAQHLNHCATAVPSFSESPYQNYKPKYRITSPYSLLFMQPKSVVVDLPVPWNLGWTAQAGKQERWGSFSRSQKQLSATDRNTRTDVNHLRTQWRSYIQIDSRITALFSYWNRWPSGHSQFRTRGSRRKRLFKTTVILETTHFLVFI